MKTGGIMKLRIVFLAALLLLLCVPQRDGVESCAFPMYEDSRDVFFYFFDPGLALDARLRPLSFAGLPAATPPWDSAGDAKKDNLDAWAKHLEGKFSAAEIEAIVYQAPLADLLAAAAPAPNPGAPALLQRFAASREDLAYVTFSRRCEPLVAPPPDWSPWDEEDWRDYPAMAALLEEAKKLRQQARDPFIRERCAFQAVRLAFYSGQHEQAVRLFDAFFPGPPGKGMIHYWSLALKAGALKRLGREAEAAYLFSLVFERCRSKRAEAHRGFRIGSDEAYRACLALCRDGRERSVVHFLHGLDFNNSALEEMAAIERELPDSPHLEVLLAREIARIERKLHGAAFNERTAMWDWPLRDPDDVFRSNLERLEAFLAKVVAKGRAKRADFWRLARGYAQYLGSKHPEAREALLALRDAKAATPAVRRQAETFLWLADIAAFKQADRESENRLYREYVRIRGHFPLYAAGLFPAGYYSNQPWREEAEGECNEDDMIRGDPKFRFLRSALLRLYGSQGDKIKTFLATEFQPGGMEPPVMQTQVEGRWQRESLRSQLQRIDGLIAFVQRADRNEWENTLLKAKYPAHTDIPAIARLLAEQKGMLLMRRCLWSEAVAALKGAGAAGPAGLQRPDPFQEHGLHPWGGWSESQPQAGDKLQFARAMADLTARAASRPDAGAYYRLGCALYNISYFGPAWPLLTFERSSSGDYDRDTTAFLLKEAARRFAQAEKAAKDKELSAKACFRQADIALKLHVFSESFDKALQAQPWKKADGKYIGYDERRFRALAAFANPHFPRFEKEYAGTARHGQVIRECKLFEFYRSRE
jgi:hypothetical protein